MFNPPRTSSEAFLGKLIRLPLKLIPAGTVIKIRRGPLRGAKWIKGSGVNGYWLGTYEAEEQKWFAERVKNGDVVYDIGANVGIYTLLASRLVGNEGKVYAFEPLPENIEFLKKHLVLNDCRNTEVVESAVSVRSGTTHFRGSGATGAISGGAGDLAVRVSSLDDLLKEKTLFTTSVRMSGYTHCSRRDWSATKGKCTHSSRCRKISNS